MPNYRAIVKRVDAQGSVEKHQVEALRQVIYADGKINRTEADFLVELHRRVRRRTVAFDEFFYKAIKDYILADGGISPYHAKWLRIMIFADGRVDEREAQFLRELKWEAKVISDEFDALYKECTAASAPTTTS